MKKFLALFLTLFITIAFAMPVAGAVGLEIGVNVVITKNILDDTYVVAGNAIIDADVYGDLYILGGNVTINSNVHEDLVVAGGRVSITGDVSGDLRILGGFVAVYGNVGDDILIAGGQVHVGKSSIVGGSLISGAVILTVDGTVKEDIRGGMGMLFLNGTVERDVVVTIEDTITVSENAKIKGDLKYSALLETTIPEGVVNGEISFNQFERKGLLETLTYFFALRKIFSFLSALILAAILIAITPNMLIKAAKITRENVLKTFGVGLLTMIVAVVSALILFMPIAIGVPFGLIISAILLIIIYISKIFVSVWLAGYVFDFKKKISKLKLFGGISLAMLVYYLIGMIPFVGWLIDLVLFLIGVGAIFLLNVEYFKFMKKKNMV
jgi:predicted acyltransferase (DUF342 family)